MRIIKEKEYEKRKKKLESKITKAFYKGDEDACEFYRLKFAGLFRKSLLYANLPEGQDIRYHVEFPEEETSDPVRLEVLLGKVYTRQEYDEKLRKEQLDRENQKTHEIFDL